MVIYIFQVNLSSCPHLLHFPTTPFLKSVASLFLWSHGDHWRFHGPILFFCDLLLFIFSPSLMISSSVLQLSFPLLLCFHFYQPVFNRRQCSKNHVQFYSYLKSYFTKELLTSDILVKLPSRKQTMTLMPFILNLVLGRHFGDTWICIKGEHDIQKLWLQTVYRETQGKSWYLWLKERFSKQWGLSHSWIEHKGRVVGDIWKSRVENII